MKFGPVPVDRAEGKILGHNVAGPDGRRLLRKGRPLSAADLEVLRRIGRSVVYVAELESGDVDEETAAARVAKAVSGANLRNSGPATGRVNLLAGGLGVLRVDVDRLNRINECEGITIATLRCHSPVQPRQTVATVKILPYAVPETILQEVEAIAASEPVLRVDRLPARKVALILSGSPAVRDKLRPHFAPLTDRVRALGSEIVAIDDVSLEDESGEVALASTLTQHLAAGIEVILLAGETAVMDRNDVAPRAIERAGGRIECLGSPVDPGNLLMLAYLDEVPILGAPGCARSRKTNVVDWILPRLLAGDQLTRSDILSLGHGGLLEDIPERPMPRNRVK